MVAHIFNVQNVSPGCAGLVATQLKEENISKKIQIMIMMKVVSFLTMSLKISKTDLLQDKTLIGKTLSLLPFVHTKDALIFLSKKALQIIFFAKDVINHSATFAIKQSLTIVILRDKTLVKLIVIHIVIFDARMFNKYYYLSHL